MKANINPKTNISYGVIAVSSLADWVWDEIQSYGRSLSHEAYIEHSDIGRAIQFIHDAIDCLDISMDCVDELKHIVGTLEQQLNDEYAPEEEEFEYNKDGLHLQLTWLGGAPLIYVMDSPHTRMVRQCSPCCPNAGDLDTKDGNIFAYDLPKDWYC